MNPATTRATMAPDHALCDLICNVDFSPLPFDLLKRGVPDSPRLPGPEAGINPATTDALGAKPPDPWSFGLWHWFVIGTLSFGISARAVVPTPAQPSG